MSKVAMGDPMDRVESLLKVTGGARYAVEYNLPDEAYGVLVTSTIAKGRIKNIDTKAAERASGVLAVITYQNSPKVPGYEASVNNEGARVYGQEFRLFYDDKIYHNYQPVALVVANTLQRAEDAATMVKVSYAEEPHQTNMESNLSKAIKPTRHNDYSRGTPDAYKTAPVKIVREYRTPVQVHNPMEPHATTAVWDGEDKVRVYNKTQATKISQKEISKAFDLKEENVLAHSPFVGGAFGSSSRVWPQEMAAILGAKVVGRPVQVMLKREQVFNMVGYRPRSVQIFGVGATADGKLVGITHEAYGTTSQYEQFTERLIDPSKSMYSCPNFNSSYRLVQLDMSTPCWTRGPGETSGSFALESAMDELAYALKIDPLALRLKNYAEKDPENNKPWSSIHLKECFEKGAERFGWSKRNPTPRSNRAGDWLVGTGMAAGIYKAARDRAVARAILDADGSLLVQCAVADTGPGSATIFTQIAADVMGLDRESVRFEWGNSTLPYAPGQFGSHTTASVGSAVYDVCSALKQKLQELAVSIPGSPLQQAQDTDLIFENGTVKLKSGTASQKYSDILQQHNLPELVLVKESKGDAVLEDYSSKSFCSNFVEVHVHAATGEVRVKRVVSAVDAGKIMNHKTAESQVYGSVVWGIGIALMEEGIIDHRFGRHINNDLSKYHVPVNADVPNIDVIFIDKADPIVDPMGAKGLGEIPLIGLTAAIANAVYHATGKRVYELPITPAKLV
ncbi:xanthine dehydrogenase family protein molybdopterin-binding subunit [Pontibacter harenae]|uniref:xanthine dehydrogenase family protein molybdopterin-binding subunit n=1 Tax=Pontibacter harenae TaxID=2894083 RepID=UPI001E4D4114|nr:xanthine dehydrogenase family protein molybdopterin-binding subunit [Pontibacter harenae]MCC9166625.1 xanthine dehydrogenase family protein molybdopterin-binding subunit [Pontibacter harenae]